MASRLPCALLVLLSLCPGVLAQQAPMPPAHVEDGRLIVGGVQDEWLVEHYPMTRSGVVDFSAVGAPSDCWYFDQSVGATYTSDCAGRELTVHGGPVRRTDGTWPSGIGGAQGYAWSFAGSQYLIETAAPSPPTGDFSVQCVLTPTAISAAIRAIVGNVQDPTGYTWYLYTYSTSIYLGVSDDGTTGAGHWSTISKDGLALGVPAFVTATYDYISDGASVGKIYLNTLSPGVNTAMDGPPYSGGYNLTIGARGEPSSYFTGTIHYCALWKDKVLTQADHDRMYAEWQGRMAAARGDHYIRVTSAAPSAMLVAPPGGTTEPFLVTMPPNSKAVGVPASGRGGLNSNPAYTNRMRRASFESWTAGGTCTNFPTGVGHYCVTGDGSARPDPDYTTSAHGRASIKYTLTGTTSLAQVLSRCQTDQSLRWRSRAFGKCASGACRHELWLLQYASDNCTTGYLGFTLIKQEDMSSSWSVYDATFDGSTFGWHGSANSYLFDYAEDGDGGVVSHLDAWQLISSATTMPVAADGFCSTDTDADAVCSADVTHHPSVLTATAPMMVSFMASTPWAGVDLASAAALWLDGTSWGATNSMGLWVDHTTDELAWQVVDGAGAVRSVGPNVSNWAASTDYAVRAYHDGTGSLGLRWAGAWRTAMAGAGTGTRRLAQLLTYIGGSNTGGSDVWVRDLKYFAIPEHRAHLYDRDRIRFYP